MAEGKHSFPTSLPGILTGVAALVTAGVSAYALINKSSVTAAPQPQPSPSAALQPTAPPTQQPVAAPATEPVAGGPFSVTAVVDDPDGYVNVRQGPSTQNRIVATVRLNETIRTHPQPGAWWLVRTQSGTQGYIHASRIRMIEG